MEPSLTAIQNALPDIPGELPLLPLRHLLLSPGMILPLFVGEPHELLAVETALKTSGYLFLALCNHDQQGLPPQQKIHPLGCIALLLQHSQSADGRLKILVQGLNKATIQSFVQTQPFYAVAVRSNDEEEPAKLDPSVLLLMNRVRANGIKWFVLHGMYAQDAEVILESATTPERLADLVVADLRLSADTRRQLLTITDPMEKLRKVHDLLLQQLEQTQIKAEIRFEADEAIHRRHRERYLREQLRAIRRELGELDDEDDLSHYRTRIEQVRLPKEARSEALRQLRRLQQMHTDAAEAAVIRSYLDWLVELPWQKSSRDALNLRAAQQILDDNHYNMVPIKERILDFLGVCKLKRRIKGPILCLVGPPGVGKTSLGRSIAKAMGRRFMRISLGGLRDEARDSRSSAHLSGGFARSYHSGDQDGRHQQSGVHAG